MPDQIFSPARLRAYRVMEQEGLGEAPALQILNAIASARLWLPLSLIEIAFRNAVDGLVSTAHPAGGAWLCDGAEADAEVVDWSAIRGRAILRRTTSEEAAAEEDDSPVDPVAVASRMAARHDPESVTRDDVVAHLMLGFWVFRAPGSLLKDEPPIDVYELLARHYDGAFGGAAKLRDLMSGDILLTRNRVAHHEPMLIRTRYIFDKKTGEPRRGNDLVTSLLGALGKFRRLTDTIVSTAAAMAPMAADELDALKRQVDADTAPLETTLQTRLEELKRAKEGRKAERRAAWAQQHPDDGTNEIAVEPRVIDG